MTLGVLILKLPLFQIKNIKKSVLLGVFGLKILAGLALTGLYSHYYSDGKLSGDTAHYFEDGKVLNQVFDDSPSDYMTLLLTKGSNELVEKRLGNTAHWTRGEMDRFNDNRFIIRVNSIVSFFSGNSIYVHAIIFAFLAFVGLVLFYKAIEHLITHFQILVFLLICLFPSILFWTSSILKESLLIFGFGLLVYGLSRYSKMKLKGALLIILGLFFMVNTKIYFLLCLFPALFVYQIISNNWKKSWFKIAKLIGVGLLILYGVSNTKVLDPISYISQKQHDFILVGVGGIHLMDSHSFYSVKYSEKNKLEVKNKDVEVLAPITAKIKRFGDQDYEKDTLINTGTKYKLFDIQVPSRSLIKVPIIDNKLGNFIKYSPIFISNVMFRPLPNGGGSNLKWLNIAENLFLYLLIIFTIVFRKKASKINQKLFFFSITFILLFYLLIGATTPVVGAMVRYKTPAFLIWILFFLSIIDLERINLMRNKKKT